MTLWGPFETFATFQHSSVYVVFVVGDTVSLFPVVDFQPVQPPVAQHPAAVPVTVQVRTEESPEMMVVGEPEKLRVGAEGIGHATGAFTEVGALHGDGPTPFTARTLYV